MAILALVCYLFNRGFCSSSKVCSEKLCPRKTLSNFGRPKDLTYHDVNQLISLKTFRGGVSVLRIKARLVTPEHYLSDFKQSFWERHRYGVRLPHGPQFVRGSCWLPKSVQSLQNGNCTFHRSCSIHYSNQIQQSSFGPFTTVWTNIHCLREIIGQVLLPACTKIRKAQRRAMNLIYGFSTVFGPLVHFLFDPRLHHYANRVRKQRVVWHSQTDWFPLGFPMQRPKITYGIGPIGPETRTYGHALYNVYFWSGSCCPSDVVTSDKGKSVWRPDWFEEGALACIISGFWHSCTSVGRDTRLSEAYFSILMMLLGRRVLLRPTALSAKCSTGNNHEARNRNRQKLRLWIQLWANSSSSLLQNVNDIPRTDDMSKAIEASLLEKLSESMKKKSFEPRTAEDLSKEECLEVLEDIVKQDGDYDSLVRKILEKQMTYWDLSTFPQFGKWKC